MYRGKYISPYTTIGDDFNPKLSLISNSYLIDYINWYKSHIKKTREIYSTKSNIKSFFMLLDVLFTGSWKSSKYILISALLLIFSFSIFYYFNSSIYKNVDDFKLSVYYSIRYFFNVGIGDLEAKTFTARLMTVFEGLLGYGYLGMLLYRFSIHSDKKY